MTPAPQREEALFQAAAQLLSSQRAAFLDQECRGQPELRERLETLLAAYELRDSFMSDLTQEFPPAPEPGQAEAPDEAIGMTIGRYKLLEKVGEGGCGVVYVAEQTEPIRRRVALKVIKLGMDSRPLGSRRQFLPRQGRQPRARAQRLLLPNGAYLTAVAMEPSLFSAVATLPDSDGVIKAADDD